MQLSQLLLLSLITLLVEASPLGDRAMLARRDGVPLADARRFILRSKLSAPPACMTGSTSSNSTFKRSSSSIGSSSISVSGWNDLCLASADEAVTANTYLCLELGEVGWNEGLSASASPCLQQTIADDMISYAKSADFTNSDQLISYAVAYRQLPREAVKVLGVVPSTPYCTTAPINPELSGVTNSQPDGVDPGLYGSPSMPIMPFGEDGTCPYGSTADISSCSCSDSSTGNATSVSGTDTGSSANVTDTTGDTSSSCDACIPSANATSFYGTTSGNATVDSGCSCDSSNSTTAANATVTGDTSSNSTTTDTSSGDSTETASANGTSVDTAAVASATATLDQGTSSDTSATSTASAAQASATKEIDGDINDPAGR